MSKNHCPKCENIKDRSSKLCATCYKSARVVRKYYCPKCGKEMSRRSVNCAACAGFRSGFDETCPECGKAFHTSPALKKRNRTCCSIECARKYFTGERNPNWKGGYWSQRHRHYKTPEYLEFVKAVLKRDNYTCQDCGNLYRDLEVHHIKPWGEFIDLRCDPDNGITLCKSCHNKTKRKHPKPNRIDTPIQRKPCDNCGGIRDKNAKRFCPECRKLLCCPICGSTKCHHPDRPGFYSTTALELHA